MLSLTIATAQPSGCSPEQVNQVIVKCGSIAGLTKEQQAKASAELRALPPGSVIGEAIVPDWIRMRDEARACATKAVAEH